MGGNKTFVPVRTSTILAEIFLNTELGLPNARGADKAEKKKKNKFVTGKVFGGGMSPLGAESSSAWLVKCGTWASGQICPESDL